MITSITVKDYKEFKYLKLNNLKRINIIIGKNGVGKTNLLKWFDSKHSRLITTLIESGEGSGITWKKAYIRSVIPKMYNSDKEYILNCIKLIEPKFGVNELCQFLDSDGFMGNNYISLGMSNFLYILFNIYEMKNGSYLLIDNIDTGFHHSVMNNVWKVIIDEITKKDINIFCTTHSLEFITSLFHVNGFPYDHSWDEWDGCNCKWCDKDEKFRWYNKDLVSIYRLERHNYKKNRLEEFFMVNKLNYPIEAVNIDEDSQVTFAKFGWEMR